MLVCMRNDSSVNDTLPGKVQSYMAAGKPILGSIAGETPYIIQEANCGLCAPPGDVESFTGIVRSFRNLSHSHRKQMGENARAYYTARFTQRLHMDKLEILLLSLSGKEG